jgi:hypothetical protein
MFVSSLLAFLVLLSHFSDLSYSLITGTIPTEFANLKLQTLFDLASFSCFQFHALIATRSWLNDMRLTGPLPTEYGTMTSLTLL